jgi:hypothetical protein
MIIQYVKYNSNFLIVYIVRTQDPFVSLMPFWLDQLLESRRNLLKHLPQSNCNICLAPEHWVLSLFVSLTPKVSLSCQPVSWAATGSEFSRIRRGSCATQAFADAWSQGYVGWFCMVIRLKRIYNFWCSMLIFTPFALCFVTLCGVFMRFLELTYWQDVIVPVPCFLLFLCFRKAT